MAHAQARRREGQTMAPETAGDVGPDESNAFAQQRLEQALSGQDGGSQPGTLPYRSVLEDAFGVDLGGVGVFLGAGEALASAGASAATDGNAVAFADTAPDLETVAHEVAHVVQAGIGWGGSGVDRGGAAEVEAEDAAQAVARGQSVTMTAPLDAAVHRRVENPRTFDPTPTTDEWETVHRDIELGDGYSTSDEGMPTDQASGDTAAVAWEIRLQATEDAPLQLSGCPRDDQLYEVVAEGEECTGAGESVTVRNGSTADPNVVVRREEDALYIGGTPTVDDIMQGAVGDCYFLAAVSNITAQDPQKITASVQNAGTNVAVTLNEYDGTTWKPKTITTDRTALHWLDKNNPTTSYPGLVASGARVGDAPSGTEWYAKVRNGSLEVYRRDLYEMALWAPLLEKAYARFAEVTNQYGNGPARDTPTAGTSGYEKINGGWEDQVYPIFYGNDMIANRQEDIDYVPGQDPVGLNEDAIRNLLRVMGEGVPNNQRFLLSVDLDQGSAVDRLVALITHIEGLREARPYPSLLRIMGQVKRLGEAYQTAANAGSPTDTALANLARGCARQVVPGAWPLLQSERSAPIWHELDESLNIVSHLGTDASDGQRATYADHAYAVLGASFVDVNGAAMALTQANLHAQLAQISGTSSTVQMRNPHHTNEPNLPTSQVDSNTEDGLFSMTLDQYLRSFALQEIGEVRDTP